MLLRSEYDSTKILIRCYLGQPSNTCLQTMSRDKKANPVLGFYYDFIRISSDVTKILRLQVNALEGC